MSSVRDEVVINGNGMVVPHRLFGRNHKPSVRVLEELCSQTISRGDYPLSTSVEGNIPIYNLREHEVADIDALQDEWHHVFRAGPGVLVFKGFFTDMSLLDRVNGVFDDIIAAESANARGDHFAASGTNSRIWNSFQKHADYHPASFVRYYSNPWLARVCEAWLGPAYQVTAQVNVVRPGGRPQTAHRDYHLGFQTAESCARFPRTMHVASQFLTLQGAVAHTDMPPDSGPTRFLPFSQRLEDGFVAWRLPAFQEYFDAHWVSVSMIQGDAVFFNPALFHAAGENKTQTVERSANLLQISSPFGKTMENIDTLKIIENCWGDLSKKYQGEGWSGEVAACVAAVANGYPFPTNLDRRPPAPGGMAPESEADIVRKALKEGLGINGVLALLNEMRAKSAA